MRSHVPRGRANEPCRHADGLSFTLLPFRYTSIQIDNRRCNIGQNIRSPHLDSECVLCVSASCVCALSDTSSFHLDLSILVFCRDPMSRNALSLTCLWCTPLQNTVSLLWLLKHTKKSSYMDVWCE